MDAQLLAKYDFVDFGCSNGGSMKFAMDRLGGENGIGFDINPEKVEKAKAMGLSAHLADVSSLDPAGLGTARFVIASHFLEHLPSLELAELCISSACRVAEEFVFIRQPFFDADVALEKLGLKLYWSSWRGHTNHMTTLDFVEILERLKGQGLFDSYTTFHRYPIENSNNECVHPTSSPRDQHAYDPAIHPKKPITDFEMPVFREVGCVILKKPNALNAQLRNFLKYSMIV